MSRIIRRAISILLAVMMIMVYMPATAFATDTQSRASGTCGENVTWELSDSGELIISGTGEMEDYSTERNAPWYSSKDLINRVTVNDGVTTIGRNAFYCYRNLKVVNLPASVTAIGGFSFYSCPITDTCYIGSEVEWKLISIGSNNSKLKNPARFHYNCSGYAIAEKRIEPTCTTEGFLTRTCKNCSYNSTEILSVEHEYVDGYCTKCGDREVLASGETGKCTWILYGDGTLNISGSGNMANYSSYQDNPSWYSHKEAIKSVVIEEGVTSIGRSVFSYCSNLTSVTIPDSVTSINDWAFAYCKSLRDITIPDSVVSLGDCVFWVCESLANVTIPDSITSIGDGAFWSCESLTSITIPNSVTSIGELALGSCKSLTDITIPDSVVSIGECAFDSCNSLQSITIPKRFNYLGEDVFRFCDNLKYIFYCGSIEDWNKYINLDVSNVSIHYNATDHIWMSEWTVDIEPTCTKQGSKSQHCMYCDAKINVTTIPVTEHIEDLDEAVAATCTTDGKTEGSHCSVCNAIIKAQEVIPATGHVYSEEVTEATLSQDGDIRMICSVCGYVESATPIFRPSEFVLSALKYVYDGKVKTPVITVKDTKGNVLGQDTDYSVSYTSGRKNVGRYTAKITFKGKYSGTKALYFTINPPKTSLTSATAEKKGFTAKWSRKSSQVTGYQIQYSTNSKFTNAKTVTVSKHSTTSAKVTKLSAKRKYYVRVRTYKTVNGTNYYSDWSSAKNVTTKA